MASWPPGTVIHPSPPGWDTADGYPESGMTEQVNRAGDEGETLLDNELRNRNKTLKGWKKCFRWSRCKDGFFTLPRSDT